MDTVTLEAQSERAEFLPAFGCHCVSYRVASLDIVAGPDSLDTLREHPFRSGIPIMFPWPGRIAGARFSWNGVECALPVSEPARNNSIHGLIAASEFQVTRRGPYFMNCLLDSAADPFLSQSWPWKFELEIDLEIGNGLRMRAVVRNTGRESMPLGLGIHPYFHTAFDSNRGRGRAAVTMPADRRMLLDDRLIPTGRFEQVAGKYDFRRGRELGGETYDDVFRLSEPRRNGEFVTSRLTDPARRIAVEVRAGAEFRYWVIYAPPDKPVCAIEPYTCAPNAFNAAEPAQAGVVVLAPGAEWEARLEIAVSAL